MISPTVGRIVWFYPHGSDVHASPLAAIVTAVWSDTRVNLAVFSPEGTPWPTPPTSVLLVQEPNFRPESGRAFCTWMPYQIGQAAKAESLEKLLAPSAVGVETALVAEEHALGGDEAAADVAVETEDPEAAMKPSKQRPRK